MNDNFKRMLKTAQEIDNGVSPKPYDFESLITRGFFGFGHFELDDETGSISVEDRKSPSGKTRFIIKVYCEDGTYYIKEFWDDKKVSLAIRMMKADSIKLVAESYFDKTDSNYKKLKP